MSSIYSDYETLICEIQEKKMDTYKKWLDESPNRLHQPIKYHDKNISPLSFAIHCFDPDCIMWMLNKGINKNGLLEDGQGYYSSISSIVLIDVYFLNFIRKHSYIVPLTKSEKKKIFCMKQIIFDLLVLQGADMHIHGLNGKNLLALECSKPIPLIDVKWIKYILSKGMNPNIFNFISKTETILFKDETSWLSFKRDNHKINPLLCISWFFQPILIIYWSMIFSVLYTFSEHGKYNNFFRLLKFTKIKDWNIVDIKQDVYHILSLLLFHGANLEQCQSDNRTLRQTIQWIQHAKQENFRWYTWIKNRAHELNFDYYWKKLNRPLSDVIKRCSKYDIPRLQHLQVLLKLGTYNLENITNRKYICGKLDRKYEKYLNLTTYTNECISSTCESISKYSQSEIVEYKKLSGGKYCTWAFHISEIPNLIKTQINPFTREKITIDTIKKWYQLLDKNLLPLHYPPLSIDDIKNIKFTKPILSKDNRVIIKNEHVLEFDFSNVDDPQIKKIFELYQDMPDMNSFIQKTIRKIRKKQLSIARYLEQRKKIKIKKKTIAKEYQQPGFGIYWKKYSNKIILTNIQQALNYTSIGRYINLILWLDSWPYVLIFKLFFELYTHNVVILDQNWSVILDIWRKRKSYTRYKMKRFFIDIFIFIITNGLHDNTLNINLLSGMLVQLHKEFLYIKKLQKIVWKLYENDILTAFDTIEDPSNCLFNYLKNEHPNFFNKVIDTIKFNADDIFNISLNSLQIALHESPGFQYFETTLVPDMKHLAYFQWNLMESQDKEPFILYGTQIKENTEFQINEIWKQMQDLLYLVNNEKFYNDL